MNGETARSEPARVAEVLIRTGLALASAHDLDSLLQILADSARELVDARYGALGVINAEGTGLADFITSGLTPEQRAKMGALPTGHGILGLLVRDSRPIRLHDLRDHPDSVGVPKNHPSMRSFLGVPITSRGRVFGNLYVTEKLGGGDFDDEDLDLLRVLAAQAAIALENAQLRLTRDRFFAASSHELGNAIAAVKVWAHHLLRETPADPEELRAGLRNLAGSADQTGRLVEDLLGLSKLQEGRLTLEPWRLDVAEIIRESVAQLRLEAESAEVEIVLAPADGDLHAELDGGHLRQVVVNLISNAIRFTPPGRAVEVSASRQGAAAIRISVSDAGPGIAPESREQIFEPYEPTLGVATSRGSGLSLALSRQLARMMGGDITIESPDGGGTTFVLEVPVAAPQRGLAPNVSGKL